jgi:hypothetical protein
VKYTTLDSVLCSTQTSLPEFFESMREYGIETLQSSIYLTGERLLDAYAYVIYGGRLRGRYQEAHFHNTLPEARE